MSFIYTRFKGNALGRGTRIDLESDSIRAILVMNLTTADTEEDLEFVGDLTTLDEMDGAAYVRKVLASLAVNADDPNDRYEFDADDVTWSALGNGTSKVTGAVIYKHITNDADSPLIAYINDSPFPFDPDLLDFVLQWNAQGILQAT